ncbi:MAG: helix-turn-helix transcriptional regulator [Parvibaculum sp.]|jgi:transcriptional regulator with XRE-family HTH domain|uniref:helix-turn-helix transcriptional regulator n=1 Tax=Parvibaculum sp. TaxID=2024848 RepID=UPI002AB81899|nr:helix-turn-helix transcriptional regulator [Parvibaculum sp.]MDZ4380567.1 helix-turn-helix transcriptional regulator [Parvibaculum sp.]
MTQPRTYSRLTEEALVLLGKQIRLARKTRKMPESELAERVGVARSTLQLIEKGDPKVAVGLVFEAATLAGVHLFGLEASSFRAQTERLDDKLMLLPHSVRRSGKQVKDDF